LGPTAEASDNSRATAKARYETATRLYEIREYDKALLEYKSAYLAQPDPAFLFNIGQCYRKLGQNHEALNFFQEYLKKASPDDPNRSQVEARVRDIEAEAKLQAEAAQAAAAPVPPPEVVQPVPTPAIAPVAAAPTVPATSVEQAVPVSATPAASGRGLRIAGIACGAAGLASVGIAIYYYTRARSLSDSVTSSPNPKALTIKRAGMLRPCSGCSTASGPGRWSRALCCIGSVGRPNRPAPRWPGLLR